MLERLDIPPPVAGGVLMSLVTAAAYAVAGVDITFATTLRDVLLLVFFVTIGLSAKLSALRAGGRPAPARPPGSPPGGTPGRPRAPRLSST